MGLIKRKGSETWWYDFQVDGVRYRASTGTKDKKLAAEYESRKRNQLYSQVKLGKRQEIILRYAFGKYFEEHAKEQRWADTVKSCIKNMKATWGLDCYLSDINDNKVNDLVVALKKKGLKPASINRHLEAFRKMYRLARDKWNVSVASIDFSLHRQKEPDCRVRYLTLEEAKQLIEQAAPHLKPIIKFALYTGVRRENILSLKWKQVDLVSRRISFKVKSKMPGGKVHMVDIIDPLYKLLKKLQPKNAKPEQHVFLYEEKPVKGIKRAFATACGLNEKKRREKGLEPNTDITIIDNFRFHDLRHTCASWLVQAGTPIEVVKDILGHSEIRTTLKYAHHDSKRKLEAMEQTFKTRVGL